MCTFEEIADELAKTMGSHGSVTMPTMECAYQTFRAAGQHCRFSVDDLVELLQRDQLVSSGAGANDADALPASIEGAEYLTTRVPLSFRPEGVELSRSGINGLPVPGGANRYSPLTFTFYAYAEDGVHSYWNTEYSVWMSAQHDDPEAQQAIDEDMETAIRLEDINI